MPQTAETMTADAVPDGIRPEELLRDEDLPGYYERALAELDPDDPARAELEQARRAARRAAVATRAILDELAADDAAALLAQADSDPEGE